MPGFCWPLIALTVALLTLISYFSVKMLKGTARDALRPYAPKAMKKYSGKFLFGTNWLLNQMEYQRYYTT